MPPKTSFRRPLVARYVVCVVVGVATIIVVVGAVVVIGFLLGGGASGTGSIETGSHRNEPISCDNLDRPNLITCQILNAGLVIYGRVVRTFNADEELYHERGYTAEMEVFCTLKGGPVASRVNVSYVGECRV